MFLTGPQIRAFVEALGRAYTPNRLDQLLLGRLDKHRHNISMEPDYTTILYSVVDLANREGWAVKLLNSARASNPNNPQLLAFEESLGLGSIPVADKSNLEKIVNERSTFQDVMAVSNSGCSSLGFAPSRSRTAAVLACSLAPTLCSPIITSSKRC